MVPPPLESSDAGDWLWLNQGYVAAAVARARRCAPWLPDRSGSLRGADRPSGLGRVRAPRAVEAAVERVRAAAALVLGRAPERLGLDPLPAA